jgi:hypothetical protein
MADTFNPCLPKLRTLIAIVTALAAKSHQRHSRTSTTQSPRSAQPEAVYFREYSDAQPGHHPIDNLAAAQERISRISNFPSLTLTK